MWNLRLKVEGSTKGGTLTCSVAKARPGQWTGSVMVMAVSEGKILAFDRCGRGLQQGSVCKGVQGG